MKPTHLSLFSGIGGLDLAAERAGFQTVGQCEWADYPTKVLEKHWPNVSRWRDIRTLTKESFYEQTGLRTVDIISGGFPCQPFSVAGKRRGSEDDRYLWPDMLRVIEELRPAWVVGENVAGLVNMALDQVLSDLESQEYETRTFIIPACGVDAPHRRDRCAIVAYSISQGAGCKGKSAGLQRRDASEVGGTSLRQGYWETCPSWPLAASTIQSVVADAKFMQSKYGYNPESIWRRAKQTEQTGMGCCDVSDTDDRSRLVLRDRKLSAVEGPGGIGGDFRGGAQKHGIGWWWPVEPDVGRVAHGVPSRVDRLKCLGNAVVPAQFYPVFKAIFDISFAEWEI